MIKEYNTYPQLSVDNFVYKINENEFAKNPFLKLIVYEDNKLIKGFLIYSEIYDRIEIDQIEVLEKYQRQHIASALMDYLIAIAKKKRIINITLEVKIDNYKAVYLYHKYNFVEVAKRQNYYNGTDALLMQLIIN